MKKFGLLFSLLTCCILLTGCFKNENPEIIDDCIIPEDCIVEEPIDEDLSNKYLTAFGTEPFWSIEISGGIAKISSPMFETEYEEPVTITKEGENFYIKGEELEGEFIKKDCIDDGKGDMHYYTVGIAKFREYYYEGCGDDEKGIKMSDEEREEDFSNFMTQFSGNIKSCEKNIADNLNMIIENATDISQGWYNYINVGDSYQAEGYISYSVNGEYYTKDTTCAFQKSDFSDWGEYGNGEIEYRGHGNILGLARNDEEQECIDGLYQYEQEQMPGFPNDTITVSCYPKDYYGPEYITGYIYTTTYPDLGLKISTPGAAGIFDIMDIFLNKSETPIFTRSGNRISYINPRVNEEIEYIQVYKKSESSSLKDIIEKEYMNPDTKDCYVFEYNYYNQIKVVSPYPGTIIYGITNRGLEKEECIKGGENSMVRFFESPDKTKYYKGDFGDGCAPGPCSMFGTIELF